MERSRSEVRVLTEIQHLGGKFHPCGEVRIRGVDFPARVRAAQVNHLLGREYRESEL